MNEHSQKVTSLCPHCGEYMSYDPDDEFVTCPGCGVSSRTAALLKESDAVQVEKIRAKAFKEVEFEKQKNKSKLDNQKLDLERKRQEQELAEKFKHGKFSKFIRILTVLAAILTVVLYAKHRILLGTIGAIQTVLLILSWLMGAHIIPEKKPFLHFITAIAAIILFIPIFMNFSKAMNSRAVSFSWDDLMLCDVIPEPPITYGEIYMDSSDRLSLYIEDMDKSEYREYVKDCQDEGFAHDMVNDGNSYKAFNESGYSLEVRFYDFRKESRVDISLEAPKNMGSFTWPARVANGIIPPPSSSYGKIEWEYEDSFFIYVGNMSKTDYEKYVSNVSNSGFTIDVTKDADRFYANNSAGYYVSIEYEGNNMVSIRLEGPSDDYDADTTVPEETSSETTIPDMTSELPVTAPEETPTETTTVTVPPETHPEETAGSVTTPSTEPVAPMLVDGMRPEFKQAMDSYEAFMDEYVSFMNEVESDPSNAELLLKYGEFMEKYNKAMKDFDAWNDGTMNSKETDYYIEVQTRINKKLLSAMPS